jgi:hypothetical protein
VLNTSEQYNFQQVETELLIREAFERIGILGEYVEPQKLESAKRSINILLLDWMTKSTNLWTLKDQYIGLVAGQRQYTLDSTVNEIIQVNLRTSSRQVTSTGVPQTNTGGTYDNNGGGVAANAFDGNPLTSCEQTVSNGNISYDFGANNTAYVTFVGITFAAATNGLSYELIVDATLDDPANLGSWTPILTILPAIEIDSRLTLTYFYDIPSPINARAYRLRAVATSDPLNITELYFNNNTFDMNLGEVSRYTYNSYPNKYLIGRPSIYYLNRQITPVLTLWPAPSSYYNCLYYSYKKMMQDVGAYFETIDVPAKLYPALIWGLTWQLALKFKPEMAEMLEGKYEQAFRIATTEDSEDVPLTIKRGD